MQPFAVTLIMQEHRAIGLVLRALREEVVRARRTHRRPDFDALRTMLFYLDEMPTRLHHAGEDELLFPRIRERCPALMPVLDRLATEHVRGETAVRELERGLMGWKLMGEARRESFELQMAAYAEGYAGHMEVEERYVLPVALDYLAAADWLELEEAFRHQRAALAPDQAPGHQQLFEQITSNLQKTEQP